jgi:cytochrome c oxidase subunit 2
VTGFSLFPEQASTIAPRTDGLLFFLLSITTFFVVLIAGLILYFMIRYRRRSANEVPAGIHGSLMLESVWTVIPFLISMVIFFWGASIFASLTRPPDDALQVNVVGKQWMWKVQHMNGRREINELHMPVGRPVRVTMTSEDVIHSFFVPAFRTKQDAVPGRYTWMWFEATKPGTYHLFCAEYCGTLHSGMIGKVVVMEPAAFQAWLSGSEAGEAPLSAAAAGERVFTRTGCPSCHAAVPGARGPALAGLLGSTVKLRGGRTVTADEGYVRESIFNPTAKVVDGYDAIMPTYQGLLTEEDVMQLIAYLRSLSAQAARGSVR